MSRSKRTPRRQRPLADYRGDVSTDAPSTSPSDSFASDGDAGSSAGGETRYRCRACGNLTRFDVVTSRRTRAFHHYSVGGELTVEDVEVLDAAVEEVSCRWCGHGKAIETVARGTTESSSEGT